MVPTHRRTPAGTAHHPMPQTARLLVLALLASLVFAVALARYGPASAALPYSVSVIVRDNALPAGSQAAIAVRVEGQTTALPAFDYAVEGAELSGVLPPNPVAANIAEGAVFINRATPGAARLTVSFAGQVLATADLRFTQVGQIEVRTSLSAGPEAAARTWRYEVLDASGQVVATLTTSTSGDSPTGSASTAGLPHGFYTIRQVLTGDTRAACAPGAFYEVTSPTGAATTVELTASALIVPFAIRPCPDLPAAMEVLIPVDPVTQTPSGETPVEEVRGVREPGPTATPLPPGTGNTGELAAAGPGSTSSVILLGAAALAMLTLASWPVVAAAKHLNR